MQFARELISYHQKRSESGLVTVHHLNVHDSPSVKVVGEMATTNGSSRKGSKVADLSLHRAVFENDARALSALVRDGADLEQRDVHGMQAASTITQLSRTVVFLCMRDKEAAFVAVVTVY